MEYSKEDLMEAKKQRGRAVAPALRCRLLDCRLMVGIRWGYWCRLTAT